MKALRAAFDGLSIAPRGGDQATTLDVAPPFEGADDERVAPALEHLAVIVVVHDDLVAAARRHAHGQLLGRHQRDCVELTLTLGPGAGTRHRRVRRGAWKGVGLSIEPPPPSLDVVRDIHDVTGSPIVLAGTSGVLRTVFDSDDGGQFASRVAVRLDLESYLAGGEGGDGGPLHTPAEIVKLFYSDRVKLSSDGAQALARISNVPGLGGLRLAKQVFRAAVDAAVADGRESIDAQLVRATLKSLQGVDTLRRVEAGFAAQHRRIAAVA